MKYIISERQYKLLTEDEDRKILKLPGSAVFGGWEGMQKFLELKGNPLFSVSGNLDLFGIPIESLDNLVSVDGNLNLGATEIKSLANLESVGGYLNLGGTKIKSLANLESVGGNFNLYRTKIKSLKNLQYVGGNLDLVDTPLSRTTTEEEIRNQVKIKGQIYLE
jgi:hypothetical protein